MIRHIASYWLPSVFVLFCMCLKFSIIFAERYLRTDIICHVVYQCLLLFPLLYTYPTLPYPTLPYPTLPYPTLPYPTRFYLKPIILIIFFQLHKNLPFWKPDRFTIKYFFLRCSKMVQLTMECLRLIASLCLTFNIFCQKKFIFPSGPKTETLGVIFWCQIIEPTSSFVQCQLLDLHLIKCDLWSFKGYHHKPKLVF